MDHKNEAYLLVKQLIQTILPKIKGWQLLFSCFAIGSRAEKRLIWYDDNLPDCAKFKTKVKMKKKLDSTNLIRLWLSGTHKTDLFVA